MYVRCGKEVRLAMPNMLHHVRLAAYAPLEIVHASGQISATNEKPCLVMTLSWKSVCQVARWSGRALFGLLFSKND